MSNVKMSPYIRDPQICTHSSLTWRTLLTLLIQNGKMPWRIFNHCRHRWGKRNSGATLYITAPYETPIAQGQR